MRNQILGYAYISKSGTLTLVDERHKDLPHVFAIIRREPVVRLVEKWEVVAKEQGVVQFSGKAHGLFANELRTAAGLDVFNKG